tara:strand:- start:641 stop:1009 length:369 start_codon:yes stop_codon:yes gene_type:complete
MQEQIKKKCDELRDLLLRKNNSYGNSVFERGVVFDVDPIYAVQARINDKLNRLKNNDSTFASENDLQDLTGYLILLQVMIEDKSKLIHQHPVTPNESWSEEERNVAEAITSEWTETSTSDGD